MKVSGETKHAVAPPIVRGMSFGGLSVEDTAAVLRVSVETVTRDWRLARGWLLVQIRGAEGSGASGMARGSAR